MSTPEPSRRCRLSVAMIVRDEAQRLPAALRSVQAVADEIVVLDTGSSDDSAQVAAAHGARVERFDWTDDFSAARNTLWERLQGDWVLWLDASEQLLRSDAADLRRFVDERIDPQRAYLLWIEQPPAVVDGHAEQIAQPRLVPRQAGIRFEGRVRETMLPSLAAAGIELELTPWRLLRSADEHDTERKRAKQQRNLKLARLDYAAGDRSPRVLLALGDVATALGRWAEARDYFRRAIRAAEEGSTEMLEGYYGLLTAFAGDPEDHEPQLAACVEATSMFPFDAQLLCAMGSYLQNRGRMDLASRSYEAAHRAGHVDPQTWHLVDISEVASLCYAVSLDMLGKAERAEEVLHEALERHPDSVRLRRHLIEQLIQRGALEAALDQAALLPAPAVGQEPLRSAIRGAHQAAQRNWIPAMSHLETAFRAGCRDPLCLRWLSICLMATGSVLDAEPVLRMWEKIEPSNLELRRYMDLLRDETAEADTAEGRAAAPAAGPEAAATLAAQTGEPASTRPASPAAAAAMPEAEPLTAPQQGAGAIIGDVASMAEPAEMAPGQKRPSGQSDQAARQGASGQAEEPATSAISTDEAHTLRKLRIDSANNPLDGAIHFRLGETYRRRGDESAAERVWRSFLSRSPRDPQVARALSELLLEQDRLAEAIELASRCGAESDNEPLGELLRGIRAARQGQWSEALSHFEASRAAGYDRPILYAQMADCLIAMGRQREAEPLLRDLVRIEPENPHHYERLARFLNQNGKPEEARSLRRRAQQMSPLRGPHSPASFSRASQTAGAPSHSV